MFIMIHYQ